MLSLDSSQAMTMSSPKKFAILSILSKRWTTFLNYMRSSIVCPFSFRMTLTGLANVPWSHLGRCFFDGPQHTPWLIVLENEGAWNRFHPYLVFLWICFESDFLVTFSQKSLERRFAGNWFLVTFFNVLQVSGLRGKNMWYRCFPRCLHMSIISSSVGPVMIFLPLSIAVILPFLRW